MLNVLRNIAAVGLEQIGLLLLRQSDGLVLKAHINFRKPILGLIEDDFSVLVHDLVSFSQLPFL